MDFRHTRFSLSRPLTNYAKIQHVIASLIRNRSWFIDQRRLREKEYVDVGCGANIHEHFITLDYAWRPGLDLCWDITQGIPLPDHAVRGLFTEHCLEHLPFKHMDRVLGEFRRILKPNGCARIVVPDGELYLTRYTDMIRHQSQTSLPYAADDTHNGLYSPMMSVNRVFRAHGHLFIYDFATLRLLLEKHGFLDIKKERYKTGRDPRLLIDTDARSVESLYVEASAPATPIAAEEQKVP